MESYEAVWRGGVDIKLSGSSTLQKPQLFSHMSHLLSSLERSCMNMIKRALLSLLLLATVFTVSEMANFPQQYRLKFEATRAFALQQNATVTLPAGKYWIVDLGTGSRSAFALQNSNKGHLALLTVVRMERTTKKDQDGAAVKFDYESGPIPVLKTFFVPTVGGWEVVSASYNKNSAKYFIEPPMK
jgi:hypothetical protein